MCNHISVLLKIFVQLESCFLSARWSAISGGAQVETGGYLLVPSSGSLTLPVHLIMLVLTGKADSLNAAHTGSKSAAKTTFFVRISLNSVEQRGPLIKVTTRPLFSEDQTDMMAKFEN